MRFSKKFLKKDIFLIFVILYFFKRLFFFLCYTIIVNMTIEIRYIQLNFLDHEDQLRKVWKQDVVLKSLSWKVLNQLMQLDDTDFDLKTEFNNKAPTLSILHE